MSDLGLGFSHDSEIRKYSEYSHRPRFISDIDLNSTKINSIKLPTHFLNADSDQISDDEMNNSITSE